MNTSPAISVIMSVYNTPSDWLAESIESICNQSFSDFEFIIIDDGSTKIGTIETLHKYARIDERIVLIKNDTNRGLTKCLNDGIRLSRGKYIARMDSDDISDLNRFKTQYSFMESNANVAVTCSLAKTFSNEFSFNEKKIGRTIRNQKDLKASLLFGNDIIIHPTVFIRKSFLSNNNIFYDEELQKAQDFGLWVNILGNGGEINCLPEVLLKYRIHSGQISNNNKSEQNKYKLMVIKSQLKKIIPAISEKELLIHEGIYYINYQFSVDQYDIYIKKLIMANNSIEYIEKKALIKTIKKYWIKNIFRAVVKENQFSFLKSKVLFY